MMPASKDGDVQTNKTDGRKFITIKVASNGRVAYRRVYLKTTHHRLVRRRARALENIEDPDVARRIVAYLASSQTPGQEADRLAELTDTMPTIPALSHEDARKDLEEIVCPFHEAGSVKSKGFDRPNPSSAALEKWKFFRRGCLGLALVRGDWGGVFCRNPM